MTPKNWNSNVPKEKTNLSIGGFLTGSFRSPLILSFSFQASQVITNPLKPGAFNLLIFFSIISMFSNYQKTKECDEM